MGTLKDGQSRKEEGKGYFTARPRGPTACSGDSADPISAECTGPGGKVQSQEGKAELEQG